MKIADLRARLTASKSARAELKAAWKDEAGAEREPTKDELETYNAALDAEDSILAQIETAQREERIDAAAAVPDMSAAAAAGTVAATAATDSGDPMLKLGKLGFIAAHRQKNAGIDTIKALEQLGESSLAGQVAQHHALMGSGNVFAATTTGAGSGADVVPTPLMEEIIPLLFADSAFMSGGPVELPLANGNLKLPRGATKPTASWGAEGDQITASDVTFDGIELNAKILRIMTPVQNSLLAYAIPSTFNFISNAVRDSMVESIDVAGIRADGTNDMPEGIRSLTTAANVFAATADPGGETPLETAKRIEDDLRASIMKLTLANIPMRNCSWLMNPNVAAFIGDLRDGNGNPYFPGMNAPKGSRVLKGYPVRETTQIPINLGAGTNETEITFADFSHIYYGLARMMQMSVSTEASYFDGSALRSAYDRDQTVLRAITEIDFDMSYGSAASVLTGATWGA